MWKIVMKVFDVPFCCSPHSGGYRSIVSILNLLFARTGLFLHMHMYNYYYLDIREYILI